MLDKYIEEAKLKKQNNIDSFYQINNEIEQLHESKEKMEQKIADIETQRVSLDIYKKRNFLQKFIYEHFSREYKEGISKEKSALDEIANFRKEINEIDRTILELKEKLNNINIEEEQSLIENLDDRDYAIGYLMQNYPELCEKEEFMTDIVKHNFKNIVRDKSNSGIVYVEALKQAKEKELNLDENNIKFKKFEEAIQHFEQKMNERINPDTDKYQIPKEYYLEVVKEFIECDDIEQGLWEIDNLKDLDGNLPKEYGEKIQSLYESKDNYLLKHTINHSYKMDNEEIEEIKDLIFVNGLEIPRPNTYGENVAMLQNTTEGNHIKGVTFGKFLQPAPMILMQVPKSAIEEKSDYIFGANTLNVTETHAAYLLPEYVVGYINSSEGIENVKFEINNREDKKIYPYRLRLGESKGTKIEELETEKSENSIKNKEQLENNSGFMQDLGQVYSYDEVAQNTDERESSAVKKHEKTATKEEQLV